MPGGCWTGREERVVGSVPQAVLEFDEAVQAPWRPALRPVSTEDPVEASRRVGPSRSIRPGERVGRVPSPFAPPARRGPAASGRPAAVPTSSAGRPVRGGRAAPSRPAPPPLHLTRRARRLLVVLGLAAGVALGSWIGPFIGGGAAGDLRLAGASTVVVEPGDTLWSIAASVAGGGGDVPAGVYQPPGLNRVDDTVLVPGQVLQVP